MRRTLVTAAAAVLLLGTAGCGDKSSHDATTKGRPSVAELTKALTGKDAIFPVKNKKTAECVAKVMYDSQLSDESLRAIAQNKSNYTSSPSDQKAATAMTTQMAKKCVTSGTTSNN